MSGILIARIAGAGSIGDYTLFMSVFVIASESTLVIDTTLIKFCSRQFVNKNEILKCAFLTKFIYSILFVLILSGFVLLFLDSDSEYRKLIICACISGCLFSFFLIEIAFNQLNSDYFKVSVLQFACQFFCFLFIALGLFLGLYGIKYLTALYLMMGTVFSLFSIWRHIDSLKSKISGALFKNFLSTSLILISAAIVNQVSNRLDVFFISGLLDKAELGYYGAALRTTSIMSLFTAATRVILVPNAPDAVINLKKRKKYLMMAMKILMIQLVLLITVVIFAKDLIMLLFGEQYIDSVSVLRILVFQVILGSAVVPFQSLIQVGPRPKATLIINIKKMFIGIVCYVTLIPFLGLSGAAMVGILTNLFLLYSFISIQIKIDMKVGFSL